MKYFYYILITLFLCNIICITSCSNDYNNDDSVIITHFADDIVNNQSVAVYNDYLFLVSIGCKDIVLYDLKIKKILCSIKLKCRTPSIYHCNQATFGVNFYLVDDYFPLLYISQRANEVNRCFTEVFRIIPSSDDGLKNISSIEVEKVQTIYYPVMSNENSMGNVNTVIDQETRLIYTYSRNNNMEDDNYGVCKISCFEIPDVHHKEVYLEDEDMIDSYILSCSAINMQGGCVKDGNLYVLQGNSSVGMYMNIINLLSRQLEKRIDLMLYGIYDEPEGCFIYNEKVMFTTIHGSIWSMITNTSR